MTDLIDTANNKAQAWTDESIHAVCKMTIANAVMECAECGNAIGLARKSAVPFATRCIKCQTMHEQRRG